MGYSNGVVTAPVSMGNIQQAVSFSSLDLGTLINSGVINAYSAVKPVRYNQVVVDDFSKADISFGFDPNVIIASALENAFSNANTYRTWDKLYYRPRGVTSSYTEWFRMLDFNGYNRNAPKPYNFDEVKNIVFYSPLSDFKNISHTFSFTIVSGAEVPIHKFKALLNNNDTNDLANWRYGVLVKKGNNGTISCSTGNALTSTGTTQSVSIKFSSTGTYNLCFVATRYNGGSDTAVKTAWLDDGLKAITITRRFIPIGIDMVDFNPYGYLYVQKSTENGGTRDIFTLYGLPSAYSFKLQMEGSSSAYNGQTVVNTSGGMSMTIDYMINDSSTPIYTKTIENAFGNNLFSYSGSSAKTVTTDLTSPPIIGDSNEDDYDAMNRVDYFKITFTPYTRTLDENNGEYRWKNGAISPSYIVNFSN